MCPTCAKVQHHPQQRATQQGPLHPRPGVAHATVGVYFSAFSQQPKPLAWQVRLMSEECNLLPPGIIPTPREMLTFPNNFAKSCLFFSPSAENRERCARGRCQRLPESSSSSSSHGWQLLASVTIFCWSALGRRSARRKRGQRWKNRRASRPQWFSVLPLMSLALSLGLPGGGSAHSALSASVVNPLLPHSRGWH